MKTDTKKVTKVKTAVKEPKTVKAVAVKPKVEARGREFVGKVVSAKMMNTVVVSIERVVQHPLYKKPIRKRNRFAAHNTDSTIVKGTMVKIKETRPMSKTKHFIVVSKI